MYRHQLDFFKSWNIFFLQHVPGQQISTVILELDQTFWGSQLAPKIGQWARVRSREMEHSCELRKMTCKANAKG